MLSACGGLSAEQKTTADEALDALRKIDAATDVGVTYQQYGPLVIEAKYQVNEANAVLPEGELKNELEATMDAYADVVALWGQKINGHDNLFQNIPSDNRLIQKYSLELKDGVLEGLGKLVTVDEAIPVIWFYAKGHLRRAEALNK